MDRAGDVGFRLKGGGLGRGPGGAQRQRVWPCLRPTPNQRGRGEAHRYAADSCIQRKARCSARNDRRGTVSGVYRLRREPGRRRAGRSQCTPHSLTAPRKCRALAVLRFIWDCMQSEPASQLAILRHLRATLLRTRHNLIAGITDPATGGQRLAPPDRSPKPRAAECRDDAGRTSCRCRCRAGRRTGGALHSARLAPRQRCRPADGQ